jgi:RNA polymerase sigma factor (sigma-70 family)
LLEAGLSAYPDAQPAGSTDGSKGNTDMASAEQTSNSPEQPKGWFTTTHWSVVVAAGDTQSPQAGAALDNLCRGYWYPLYAYVRRRGHDAETARDLTQEFFALLLAKRLLAGVDPTKGRFRSWLLGVMNHFLAHEWARVRAQKRGGGQPAFSLDDAAADERYRLEPAEESTPETIFDRRWAFTVLDQAAARLRGEYETAGKGALYSTLKGFVSAESQPVSYEEAARHLGLSQGAVKSAIHRLRQHYQELIRDEIAQTVTSPAEIDDEIRYLLAVIRG